MNLCLFPEYKDLRKEVNFTQQMDLRKEVHHTADAVYENLALRGRATQSSIHLDSSVGYLGLGANAIDGNTDPNYFHGSCFHSSNDVGPWWRVDLLDSYHISNIIITNRGDCCPERLNGAKIVFGNSLENDGKTNPSCGEITTLAAGASQTFECDGMVGRYVIVYLPVQQYLHFSEIQIIGY
ncbi:fucolectin-like [Pseudophryne corroboree]|uniref:fucolectin-like n=1 Tax=Pseudophryne corroboree TaxID=495146 RepID=UPI00308187DF